MHVLGVLSQTWHCPETGYSAVRVYVDKEAWSRVSLIYESPEEYDRLMAVMRREVEERDYEAQELL
ncbi:MAG TPA: hypothetical protein VFJ58_20620 [Armatimonadota bacterium]|nr:hypothetical protein [Armatimonadota bacterium]